MKRSISLIIAAGLAAFTLTGLAKAASMTQADVAKQIKGIAGTYACGTGKMAHTSTFKSIYGGRGMLISEAGSQEQILFDTRRQKWIDEHIDSDGNYSVMEGTPVVHGIDFVTVYPSGFDGKMAVRMPSSGKMTTRFTMTMNGKLQTQNETCTRK